MVFPDGVKWDTENWCLSLDLFLYKSIFYGNLIYNLRKNNPHFTEFLLPVFEDRCLYVSFFVPTNNLRYVLLIKSANFVGKRTVHIMIVKAKKALGQHFLKDEGIAKGIVDALMVENQAKSSNNVLEIGPGTGVLTKYLIGDERIKLELAEIDIESIEYLKATYPYSLSSLVQRDFLQMNLRDVFASEPFGIIGNFPYNISSQIFFKILEDPDLVPQVVCMLQKEVAERLVSPPGNKSYGILSVLLQAWYNMEYLFTVPEHVFLPPPKVKSGVIRLTRNSNTELGCEPQLFKQIVKACFNQRRKTIRNSIKPTIAVKLGREIQDPILDRRPEQLSVQEFVYLTNLFS